MRPLCAIIILFAALFVSLAQSSKRGTVKGMVTDSFDATIPKVQIVFANRGRREEVISDDHGNYEVQLPPGTYTVSAKQQGYLPAKPQTVRVKSKGVTRCDIKFPPFGIIEDPLPMPEPSPSPGERPNKSLDASRGSVFRMKLL